MQIGICGTGHWGKNLLRIFCELIGPQNVWIYDDVLSARTQAAEMFPGISVSSSLEELIENVSGVAIATPPTTHHAIALHAAYAGRDMLIEKPMAMTASECREIMGTAVERHCKVLVGHTFLYNPAVIKAKEILRSDFRFKRIYYIEAFRRHLGLIRDDVDAVWDLAAHDISIFNYWLDSMPLTVQAIGMHFLYEGKADTASIFLNYPGGTCGAIHVSWVDASKRRDISIIADQAKLTFDDLNPEWLVLEEKGAILGGNVDSFGEFKAQVRSGDVRHIFFSLEEPLKNECKHFLDVVEYRKAPRTPGEEGVRVVRVLEAVSTSMRRGGELTEVGFG